MLDVSLSHDSHPRHFCGAEMARHGPSAHQRHEPAAAGDFEFAEDRVKMLFHRRQTQAGAIGDLLVTAPFTDKSRKFLFSACKPDEMRQTEAGGPGTPSNLTAQIFGLDKNMRLRHAA